MEQQSNTHNNIKTESISNIIKTNFFSNINTFKSKEDIQMFFQIYEEDEKISLNSTLAFNSSQDNNNSSILLNYNMLNKHTYKYNDRYFQSKDVIKRLILNESEFENRNFTCERTNRIKLYKNI